ncbi:hypothetical protein U9M48_011642 [Paspalum notatum var. saurae]|uniref:DUF4220 domain-containing protein n=1 Tax=Paspalum notatum var. saurae TaxID=547442 RepID=A0AAQ3WHL2_PASNO
MKGYNFLIVGQIEAYNYLAPSITIDMISWDCCGDSEDGKALKDVCLSYALFRQFMTRLYFGVACPKASPLKTQDFFIKKLLPPQGDFERAFRIIEVELGFCYDFFFTKYHYFNILSTHSVASLFVVLAVLGRTILIIMVGVLTFRRSLVLGAPYPIIEVHSTSTDYIITLLVLGIALIVEPLQAALYLASDCAQVSHACRYANKNSYAANAFIGKVIGVLRRLIISGQLKNKIGQRSVISGLKPSVKVSDGVKKAIASSIRSTCELLPYDEADIKDLTKMVKEDVKEGLEPSMPFLVVAARKLSSFVTEHLSEALPSWLILKLMKKLSYDDMNRLVAPQEGDDPINILKKGINLGKQLDSSMTNGAELWQKLGEFWAKTIVSVACSHSMVKQHMEHLEKWRGVPHPYLGSAFSCRHPRP